MKYQVIVSDPPWQVKKGGLRKVRPNQGRDLDYPTLSILDIENTQADFAYNKGDKNHVLFCWTTDKYLHQTEVMLHRIGYKLHARMIWDKQNGVAPAFTVRYGHEFLLYCYFGKLLPVAKEARGKVLTVFSEQARRHSQKPEISYQIIERLYPEANKLEMYARYKRDGWDGWGDQYPNQDLIHRIEGEL